MNAAYEKSFEFALEIINLSKCLAESKGEYMISKQILRSGTSIGANLKEGMYGQSKRDFLTKVNIALKEAAETEYWLELLVESGYMDEKSGANMLAGCREIIKLLYATVKTTKLNIERETDK